MSWKGHGDGILSKRLRDGAESFYCRVTWNGRQFTEMAGTSKGAAYALKERRDAEVKAGTYVPPKIRKRMDAAAGASRRPARPTLKVWADERIEVKKSHVKRRTWEAYRDRCDRFQNAPIGALHLDEVKRRDVELWLSNLEGIRKKKIIDRKSFLDALKMTLAEAVACGLIPSNPATGVKLPRVLSREGVYIEPAARVKLIGAARPEFQPALRLAFLLGARWGELAALEWSDVDLTARRLTIRRTAGEATTKTGEARTIRLNDDAVAVLSKLPTRFPGGLVLMFGGKPLIEFWQRPKRMTIRRHYLDEWHRTRKAAGLVGIVPHDTRHSAASDLVMATGNLFTVCKVFGWTDTKMVEQVYGHLTEGYLTAAMDKLNGAAGAIP